MRNPLLAALVRGITLALGIGCAHAQLAGELAKIPARPAMLERVHALSRAETTVTTLRMGGTRLFYLKLAPGRDKAALYLRESLAGAERLLLDPEAAFAGRDFAISGMWPAPDGRHVAVGFSAGDGQSLLRVLAVEGARLLPFEIDRVRMDGEVAWHPDGRSLFYGRAPEAQARSGRKPTARIYRHVLGRATDRDEVVFASGVGGARDVPESGVVFLHLPLESRFVYALSRDAQQRDLVVHVAELRDLAAAQPRWRRLAGAEDEVIGVEGFRNDLYAISARDAPRHRVVRVRGDAPAMRSARQVVPQGESVIESLAIARDAIYLRTMVGGVDRLERAPLGLLGAKAPEFVRIPFDNAISQIVAHPRVDGALLRLQGWIEPPSILQVDRRGDARPTVLQPPAVASFGAMDEVRLYATAPDGVKIPVTLVYAKSTTLTGDNPTLLTAFGAYGTSIRPTFDAARLAWLERGGVLAFAHVRGGGEYGAAWHRGSAQGHAAQDVIAVAQFLASYGFTNPRRLVLQGTRAGALATSAALAQRPDLFAAIILRAADTAPEGAALAKPVLRTRGRSGSRGMRDAERADVYTFALWQAGERAFQPPAPPPPPVAAPLIPAPTPAAPADTVPATPAVPAAPAAPADTAPAVHAVPAHPAPAVPAAPADPSPAVPAAPTDPAPAVPAPAAQPPPAVIPPSNTDPRNPEPERPRSP